MFQRITSVPSDSALQAENVKSHKLSQLSNALSHMNLVSELATVFDASPFLTRVIEEESTNDPRFLKKFGGALARAPVPQYNEDDMNDEDFEANLRPDLLFASDPGSPLKISRTRISRKNRQDIEVEVRESSTEKDWSSDDDNVFTDVESLAPDNFE